MPAVRRKAARSPARVRRLLIANRGEIAVRVERACRQTGIVPIAVFSEADRNALHVRLASEAHCIGPAPAAQSYLNIEAILDAARRARADAIHPGYGFLAENPDFAEACSRAGLIFVGPPGPAMRALGNKVEARRRMAAAGVPVIPGLEKAGLTVRELKAWAAKVGYPILLKAAAGGGGRGMRIVRRAKEVESSLESARSEARGSFGDDSVFAERYLEQARHIEVQVLVDQKGNGVSLGERECSIQRRHQKLVEESPSPVAGGAVRERLERFALKACKAAGYVNVGTVEFLRDPDGNFYFLEMNARLQVEHPVTEMVTGVDLVQAQIRIAEGAALPVSSGPVRPRGWAIECRILAEDPQNDFRPCPGRIGRYRPPSGPHVRLDGGVWEGDEVSLHYDSLLAKLITWGPSREQSILTMASALSEYRITGLRTTLPFHRRVMADEQFRRGEIDTGFVERLLSRGEAEIDGEAEAAALVAAAHAFQAAAARRVILRPPSADPWTQTGRRGQMGGSFLRNPWRTS